MFNKRQTKMADVHKDKLGKRKIFICLAITMIRLLNKSVQAPKKAKYKWFKTVSKTDTKKLLWVYL